MDRNFYTTEVQKTLLSNVEDQQGLPGQQNSPQMQEFQTPYIGESSQWAHAHTSVTGYDYFHPLPATANHSQMPGTTVAPAYQQSFTTPDLQYSNTGAPNYQQSTYLPTSYSPSLSSMATSYPLSSAGYYTSPNLAVPGMSSAAVSSSSNIANFNTPESSLPSTSRSPSPSPLSARSHTSATHDLSSYGHLDEQTGAWTCAYPQCSSKAIFVRPCDLRKHFNRHKKNFFCRYEGCAQNHEGGFSSKKDRARHESKHNPGVQCEWDGCERVFSRVDNMRNHLARIHLKQKHS